MLLHEASCGLIIAKTPHDSFKSPYTILYDDNIAICDLSNPNSIKCAIDSYIKQLQIEFADNIPRSEVKIFGVNYNILRITQGLAGLAYLN